MVCRLIVHASVNKAGLIVTKAEVKVRSKLFTLTVDKSVDCFLIA